MTNITTETTIEEVFSASELKDLQRFLIYTGPNALPEEMTAQTQQLQKMPLSVFSQMHWDPAGIAYGLNYLMEVRRKGYDMRFVYTPEECEADPSKKDVGFFYLPPKSSGEADGAAARKPFIVLCAGGGYQSVCSMVEAFPAAAAFCEMGYASFVVNYRVGQEGVLPMALEDLAAVIRAIRKDAETFSIEPDSYIVSGFSAGGNLASMWGTDRQGYARFGLPRPKALFPIYPVTSLSLLKESGGKEDFIRVMLGSDLSGQDLNSYSTDQLITDNYPPCYIVCCADDSTVDPRHSRLLERLLKERNIPVHLEIGEKGEHGFGLGLGTDVAGWTDRAAAFEAALPHFRYHSIRPGQVWLDTKGCRIQAHGANMFYENDTFYWYGENKEFTTAENDIWTWGVRCYSSKDLYNWTDEGLIIAPDENDPSSILHPSRKLDRPHIIKNEKTGKYVCWLKYCDNAHFSILTADHLLGPYTIRVDVLKPFDRASGDFDLAVDEATGKAYLYFEADHTDVLVVELTEDYLGVTDHASMIYKGLRPPYMREGVTHFERNGKHYIVTSGMTGYMPNPSEVAVGDDWMGPFTVQGDPHTNDDSKASFNSQISGIFRHPKEEDLYVAMADRWVPGYPVTGELYERLTRVVSKHFDPTIQVEPEDVQALMTSPMVAASNTSVADYVWLPFRFDGDRAYLDWKDEWTIS